MQFRYLDKIYALILYYFLSILYMFYRFNFIATISLISNDELIQDGGHVNPSGDISSQVQLPVFTYMFLASDFQFEGGS